MKSSLGVFLLLCGMAVCHEREYNFVNKTMIWPNAQRYCRGQNMDLATVTTDEENTRMMKAAAGFNSWIGLNRTAPRSNIWQWSDGEPCGFFKWMTGEPNNWQNSENCAAMFPSGWVDISCQAVLPFCCAWSFVMAEDSKTWDQALDYCRNHHTGLASPISPEQQALVENATAQTQTASVWTGLRFVNTQWVRVSGVPLESPVSLPSCPAPWYRCAAYNTKMHQWENRNCNEKLSFYCY